MGHSKPSSGRRIESAHWSKGNLYLPQSDEEFVTRISSVINTYKRYFHIVRSQPDRLLLDIDSKQAYEKYDEVFPVYREIYGIRELSRWVSRSGRLHIVLSLPEPMPAKERYTLQAAMGSDPMREALSLRRLKYNDREPNILFRPHDVPKKRLPWVDTRIPKSHA